MPTVSKISFIVAILCIWAPPVSAGMYKCVDDTGSTSYQSQPCDSIVQQQDIDTRYINEEISESPAGHSENSEEDVTQRWLKKYRPDLLEPKKKAERTPSPSKDSQLERERAHNRSCAEIFNSFSKQCASKNREKVFACYRSKLPPSCRYMVPPAPEPKKDRPTDLRKRIPTRTPEDRFQARIRSCDRAVSLKAIEELIANPNVYHESETLFEAAMQLYRYGRRDEAMFWFNAAKLRAKIFSVYDRQKGGNALTVMGLTLGLFINRYADRDIEKSIQVLDRVLEWDRSAPNPIRSQATSAEQQKMIDKIYASIEKHKTKLHLEKEQRERRAALDADKIDQATTKQFAKFYERCSRDKSSKRAG